MRWISNKGIAVLVAAAGTFPMSAEAVTPLKSLGDITPERIGEFVMISGTTELFLAPASRREPYSFQLRDATGKTIRVGAWPETMTAIKGWNDLATTGTRVSMTAEVIDHDGHFELQVLDWAEVKVFGHENPAADAVTTGVSVTTMTETTVSAHFPRDITTTAITSETTGTR